MRRAAPLLALLVLVGCSQPTELMLVVKAGYQLTVGTGGQIDQIRVRAQPANDPPTTFFFDKYVPLCTVEGPDCRPTKYATQDYEGALTLPIHFLLEPGDQGINDDIRVWVDGLSNNDVVLASGLRFQFSKGHRLWLELPLFPQCLGMLTCQEEDLACGSDTDCVAYTPTKTDTSDDSGASPVADLAASDLTIGDLAQSSPDLTTVFDDLATPCGDDGQKCCPGMLCNGTALTCSTTSGFCMHQGASCGEAGQGCCSSDMAMLVCNSSNLVCVTTTNSMCVACGAVGNPCCKSGLETGCNAGATCNVASSMCEACGAAGIQCCDGSTCTNSSLACVDGTCTSCGLSGQACCPGTTKCTGSGQACIMSTMTCGMCTSPKAHALGECAQ